MATHTNYTTENTSWLKGSQLLLEYEIKSPSTNLNGENPVVILLHGVGSNEQDLFRFKDAFPDDFYVVSARAPYQFGTHAYGWYEVDFSTGRPVYNKEQAAKSKLLIAQFINQLVEKYSINQEKVYLFGFSQGAIMSYSVAIQYPQKVKRIIALSGRMLDEGQEALKHKNELDVEVVIAHSMQDGVLPYSGALDAYKLLKDKVSSVQFIDHNAGHGVPSDVFEKIEF